ncbi:FkbM family methyltransferase [Alishewanella jeotgali]|uniref:Methyltransferase FkbM family protein n=1 Tax=Alishewanella jeotgali KCTC 22429 TaxID=1129374 RepID=H3ZBJ1_9ALTE|nr:FkbM family methyltransferase [Alishewanella jeotgali]EHR42305.1 methyltransferase FkbM family protein [Alishewanella jeotgali KCTC 22429]
MSKPNVLLNKSELNFIAYYQRFSQLYYSSETAIIYGTGDNARRAFEYLSKGSLSIAGFCESSAIDDKKTFMNLPVFSVDTAIRENVIILIASSWYSDIIKGLQKRSFTNYLNISLLAVARFAPSTNIDVEISWLKSMLDLNSQQILSDLFEAICSELQFSYPRSTYPQYLHPDILIQEDALVVDGGACRGEIFGTFAGQLRGKTFICFEPDPQNATLLRQHLSALAPEATVILEEKGLWHSDGMLRFIAADTSGAHFNCTIDERGTTEIRTCSIDTYFQKYGRVPDFIKMDIEGAELDALEGAKGVIEHHHPALAICTYHYLDDLWVIPRWITSVYSGYSLRLGHHSNSWYETVLYAGDINH